MKENALLGNRYEILDKIGGGGMAIVYLARDTYLERYVAVKVLRDEFVENEEFIRRFHKEAKAVASLNHPNIVNIYDFHSDSLPIYLVMEFVEGETLKNYLSTHELDSDEVVDISIQIASGLAAAHEAQIVHKDVKSQNILIDRQKRVKITDFGIAQILNNVTITHHKGVLGSAHYFSPEQARGESVDYRSDIYSLGVVMYEMTTGRVPFTGDTPVSVALKHIQEFPTPPSEWNPSISSELENIILKCLSKNPQNRYDSMHALIKALRALQDKIEIPGFSPFAKKSNNKRFSLLSQQDTNKDILESTISIPKDLTQKTVIPKVEETTKKEKKNNRFFFGFSLLLVVLVALGTIFFIRSMIFSGDIKVPDVVGMTYDEAEKVLKNKNLHIETIPDKEEIQKNDKVEKQSPEAGAKVKSGRSITLTFDVEKNIATPNLIGLEKNAAKKSLSKVGLSLGDVSEEFSDTVEKGKVIRQNPEHGVELDRGDEVSIVISKGKDTTTATVPDLRGQSLSEAKDILNNLDLIVGTVTEEYSDSIGKNTIISQGSEPNSKVEKGSKITLVVSKGPDKREKSGTTNISLTIPDDGFLIVQKKDKSGEQMIYAGNVKKGESFSQDVFYSGNGTVQVFLNDEVIKEYTLR